MKKYKLVANWKMNPQATKSVQDYMRNFKKHARGVKNVTIVFCPPSIFISAVGKFCSGNTELGAQDVYFEKAGSFTGQISPKMLAGEGVQHVILGHSERRAMGETSELVAKKAASAISDRIQPIICLGEQTRDHSGKYLKHIENQIIESLAGIPKTKLKDVVIAYEPIWAIGAAEAMSSHEMHQMVLYIKKIITKKYTRAIAGSIPVLYGGSVTADNARDMIENGVVDGLLVGRASLNPEEFAIIAKNISYAKRNF